MTRPNRAYFGITNAPGTSGNFTVGAAFDATFITLGAAHDGVTFPSVTIIEAGLGAEVRTNCTYTHGTTTLTRGTLESSTTGSAINFTSAAKVQITVSGANIRGYDVISRSGFSACADGTNQQTLTTGTGTTLITGGAGGALRTEEFDIEGWFTQSTGIFFPQEPGLWLIGASAVYGTIADGSFVAVYISHSTDGTTWSDSTNKAGIAWRGYSAATNAVIGGSGSLIVNANGTTDRWALRLFHTDPGTPIVPQNAAVRGWCRFWARRIGTT